MPRLPVAAAWTASAVLAVALTGCSPAETAGPPAETPVASTAVEPPAEPVAVIGAADMPPAPFSGDCSAMLTAQDIAEVTGDAMGTATRDDSSVEENAGALSCSWSDGVNRTITATVIPWPGLDVTSLPPEYAEAFAGECGRDFCSWQGGDDRLWITLDFFNNFEQLPRESVDRWGDELGSRVMARRSDAPAGSWQRDRTGWWPSLECEQIAQAVGAQLGEQLAAHEQGWEHRPPPWYALAHEASRVTSCALDLEGTSVFLTVMSGAGIDEWQNHDTWTAEDLGIPGIETYAGNDVRSTYPTASYALTDGINGARFTIYSGEDGFAEPPRDLAVAVAAAAASDFR